MIQHKELLLGQARSFFNDHKGIPFRYEIDPKDTIAMPLSQLRTIGWNCQGVPHRLYKKLGFPIPENLLSSEMYFDEHTMRTLNPDESIQLLDTIHIAKPLVVPPCKNHQGVVSRIDSSGNLDGIWIFHTSKETGTTKEEPLLELLESGRYTQMLAVKRHRQVEHVLFDRGIKSREVVFR